MTDTSGPHAVPSVPAPAAVGAPALLGMRAACAAAAAGSLSVAEIAGETLERIQRLNPALNAYLVINEEAVDDGRRVDAALVRPRTAAALPLAGAMISIKDLVFTRRWPTTAGSRTFGTGIVAERDAPVVARLRRAGAVIVGKTNLHEIAMGVTNANEHFGPVRNPWDPERIPGGSSGGSAAAVAASLCSGSIGTDTRGSIRIPASCCGITGLKPTRGLVPTRDVVPLSFTLDTAGPMTRSVEDAALMLGVLAGSARLASHWLAAVNRMPSRVRLGLCDGYFAGADAEVDTIVHQAIRTLEDLTGPARAVRIEGLDGVQHASGIISSAEALAFHESRLVEHPEGFGTLVRQRLEGGRRWSAVDLVRAELARQALEDAFERLFAEVDVLAAPVVLALPHRLDEDAVRIDGRLAPALAAFTTPNAPQNMAGLPALALPCGFSASGLPVGLQLIAGRKREDLLLSLGAAFQRTTDWHQRRPLLDGGVGGGGSAASRAG